MNTCWHRLTLSATFHRISAGYAAGLYAGVYAHACTLCGMRNLLCTLLNCKDCSHKLKQQDELLCSKTHLAFLIYVSSLAFSLSEFCLVTIHHNIIVLSCILLLGITLISDWQYIGGARCFVHSPTCRVGLATPPILYPSRQIT